jgi:hypothetical protein
LLQGLAVVDAALSFDGLGLETLFADKPVPASLLARLAGFDRVISWFGARDELYARQLRAIAPGCVIALPVPGEDGVITVWRHLLATIGAAARPELNPIEPPATWRDQARRVLAALGGEPTRPLLVVHPGAGAKWKLWAVENLARVIERIVRRAEAQAVIHQGPADRDVTLRLSRVLKVPALPPSSCSPPPHANAGRPGAQRLTCCRSTARRTRLNGWQQRWAIACARATN